MQPAPPDKPLWLDFYRAMRFGSAGDCGNSDGEGSIDLRSTDFHLHPSLYFYLFGYSSEWVDDKEPEISQDRKTAWFKMYGYCATTIARFDFGGYAWGIPVVIDGSNNER